MYLTHYLLLSLIKLDEAPILYSPTGLSMVLVNYMITVSAGVKMLKNLQRTLFNTAVVAVVLAAMVGCSVLAVKFSSICCILLCGTAGVLAYAVGQGRKGGTK